MALKTYLTTVTDIPTELARNTGQQGKMTVYLSNNDVTNDAHIGASNVTAANGFVLTKFTTTGVANKFTVELFAGDVLYGICDAGKSAGIGVLITGLLNGK